MDLDACKRSVGLFGASTAGRRVIKAWPDSLPPLESVLDNDPGKWGTRFEGKDVVEPQAFLKGKGGACFIVIASSYYDEIASQLEAAGLVEFLHFSSFRDATAFGLLQANPGRIASGAAARMKRALVLPVIWFGFDYAKLRLRFAEASIELVLAMPIHARRGRDSLLDADAIISYRYKQVPVFKSCCYELCVRLRVTVEDLDLSNPAHLLEARKIVGECVALIDRAERLLDLAAPDVVIYPQGHHMHSAVMRYLCVLKDIRVIALENSMVSTRLVWDMISGIAVSKITARNFYWKWMDLVEPESFLDHRDWYVRSVKSLKASQHESPDTALRIEERSKPVILYLANVLTDASVMFNSRVGSQVEAIKMTARWALEQGYTFLLKLHPRERPGHNQHYENLTLNALQKDAAFWEAASSSPDVIIDHDNRYDTYSLIRVCSVSVTVCSQAGLEALLFGKQTVLLGEAYYGGLGFTHEVHHESQLDVTMRRAMELRGDDRNPTEAARFFYIFDRLFCEEKSEEGLLRLVGKAVDSRPSRRSPR